MKKFVAIGHVTNDTEPYPHLGGSAAYAAVAAHRLGKEAHIITKCPPNHKYLDELKKLGITVHLLPSKVNTITTFQNFYNDTGARKQIVLEKQENITLDELKSLSRDIFKDAIILVAPVIGEVETAVFPFLSSLGFLAVTAQGYLRNIDTNGNVHHSSWKFCEKDLSFARAIFLSEEDLTIEGKFDTKLFYNLIKSTKVILTKSDKGATIFEKGETNGRDASAFSLQESEIKDLTGAGDTFATAFLAFPLREWNSIDTSGLLKSAIFANLFAAQKIMGKNGIGIDSIPTKEEVKKFIDKNPERITTFLEESHITSERFLL